MLGWQRACCAAQERETASAEADSVAKLRLMRQDAAAKGAQLDTLLGSSRARLEAMLGCRGQGAHHHAIHICSSVQGAASKCLCCASTQAFVGNTKPSDVSRCCVHSQAAQRACGQPRQSSQEGLEQTPHVTSHAIEVV